MTAEPRVLILQSRFYTEIADNLLDGATGALEGAGATFQTVDVPGALELPAALSMAVGHGAGEQNRSRYDGYVLLGCVIRGETSHYEVVVDQTTGGIMNLVVRHGLALGFGILTVENSDQAIVRSRVDKLDKGGEAARAALSLIRARRRLQADR